MSFIEGYRKLDRVLGLIIFVALVIGGLVASIATEGWPDFSGTEGRDDDYSACDSHPDSCAYEPELGR